MKLSKECIEAIEKTNDMTVENGKQQYVDGATEALTNPEIYEKAALVSMEEMFKFTDNYIRYVWESNDDTLTMQDYYNNLKISKMKTTEIIAAWCGSGKTYLCDNYSDVICIELEYWKYNDDYEYIKDVKNNIGKVDYILVSTDPVGLNLLYSSGFNITLIYPENNLRNEYLERYIKRDSPYEFIGTFMKHWNIWLDELKQFKQYKHIILKSGEYLSDKLLNQQL